MSPSSIVLRITWKQQETSGRLIRFLALMCIFLLLLYLTVRMWIVKAFESLALFWAICFLSLLLFAKTLPSAIPHGPITSIPKIANFFIHQMVFWMGYSEQILRQKDESEEFEGVIAILTLPFNEKHWKKKIGELLSRFGFSRFPCLQLFPAMILACLICVFYVSLCLFWSIGLLCLYVIYN